MFGKPLRPEPPLEYYKPLADYRDAYYFRRPGFWRRWGRFVAAAAAATAGLAAVGALVIVGRDERVFQSHPVTAKHASIERDCAKCHTDTFLTAQRLIQADDAIRAVPDRACLNCHDGPVHHVSQTPGLACADCHREHRGRESLARVTSADCTRCHTDLKSHMTGTNPPTFRDVAAFVPEQGQPGNGHPEFALWKGPGRAKDPGTLKFRHDKHLKAGGVGVPGGGRRELSCADCHEPDPERRLMSPVSYQKHCRECHPLPVALRLDAAEPKLKAAAAAFAAEPARHPGAGESARVVQAELRQRIVDFLRDNPGAAGDKPAANPRPLPGRPVQAEPATREAWTWVGSQLSACSGMIFDRAQGCQYCHVETGRGADGLPAFAPPATPRRWFDHAGFSHNSHRSMSCDGCHKNVAQSGSTADVLMPKLADCTGCHAPRANAARADCVECHHYHDRSKERWWVAAMPTAAHAGSAVPSKGVDHGDRR